MCRAYTCRCCSSLAAMLLPWALLLITRRPCVLPCMAGVVTDGFHYQRESVNDTNAAHSAR